MEQHLLGAFPACSSCSSPGLGGSVAPPRKLAANLECIAILGLEHCPRARALAWPLHCVQSCNNEARQDVCAFVLSFQVMWFRTALGSMRHLHCHTLRLR